jgi:hypothetical protein
VAKKVLSAILTLKDKDFSSNMKKAANGVNDFERKVKHSKNEINQFKDNAVSGFSNVAKSVAGLAAAYVGLQTATSVFSTALESASSLEGYRNTLNVVMKDQEKAAKTMAWATDFANKTPFETDSVVEATVRLSAYGLEAQKVLPAIGDMAGVMNKDVMQAVEAVADAQTGELERLKEFGITKAMISKKAGEMYKNQEIVNNKGQIVNQEKFNSALFALMNDRFKGGMDLQANTFKGVMSTITGTWKTGLATMMGISKEGEIVQGGLFDTIKDKAKIFGDYLTKMANDGTFTEMGNKIKSGIEGATHAFNTTKTVMTEAYDKGKEIYGFFKDNWGAIGPVVYGVAAALTAYKVGMIATTTATKAWSLITSATTVAMGLLNGTIAISPLGWIAIAIGAVVAAGVLLYQNWDTVKAKGLELWEGLNGVWTGIKDGFVGMWSGMKAGAKSGINFIIGGLNKLIKGYNSWMTIKAPDWIPGIGGKKLGFEIPKIPQFALGTSYFAGGLARINERGGEIVDLPSGSRVYPHDKSVQMARNESNNTFNITINAADKSAMEIINELIPLIKLRLANM